MKLSLKGPLALAAIVIVARIVVERWALPIPPNTISIVILYLIVFPMYAAFRIANSSSLRPYRDQFKYTALFAALSRAMVIPTYWLAYAYQWPEERFRSDRGGVVGPNVTPLEAYVLVPVVAWLLWTVFSTIIGGGIGSAIIAIRKRLA